MCIQLELVFTEDVSFRRFLVCVHDPLTQVRDMQIVETAAPLLAYQPLPPPAHTSAPATAASTAFGHTCAHTHAAEKTSAAHTHTHTHTPAQMAAAAAGQGLVAAPHYGPATVTKSFLGYTKITRLSGKWLDTIDLQMPSVCLRVCVLV